MPVLYYVSTGNREFGPAPLDTLRAWKEEGRLGPDTPVRVEGARDWFPAENISALYPDPEDAEFLTATSVSTPPPLPFDFGAGTLISQTLLTYRKQFFWLFALTLPLLPSSIVLGICGEFVGRLNQVTPEALAKLTPTLPWFLPAFVIHQILWPLVCGALAVATALALDGKPFSLAAVRSGLVGKVGRLLGGYLVTVLLYLLVLVPPFLLVPLVLRDGSDNSRALFSMLLLSGLMLSVILTTRICIDLMVRNQVILFENRTLPESLRRSRNLMSLPLGGSWFRRPAWLGSMVYLVWMLAGIALGMLAAIPAIGFLLGQVLSGTDPTQATTAIPPLHPWSIAFQVLSAIAKCVVLPIAAVGMTILYRRLVRSAPLN